MVADTDPSSTHGTTGEQAPHSVFYPPPMHSAGHPTGLSSEDHSAPHEEPHHNNHAYVALLFLFVMLTIGALCRTLLAGTAVPYTVALLIVGLAVGAISCVTDLGYLSHSIDQWHSIDPHLLLFAFLPGLIFESAFSLEWYTLKKCITQVTTLATLGVLIGQGLIGSFLVLVLPYNWSWEFGLMVGSTLCVTDPVAVVALLKELGASKKLGTVIEGESLFNDGTGIVLFSLFIEIARGQSFTVGQIVVFFLQVPFAGIAVGLAGALITLFWLSRVYNDAVVDISLTLTSCYLTFFVAEEVCGASGILAVVTLGAYLGAVGKPYFQIRKEMEETLHHFWEMCAYCTNTVIFILAGVIIGRRLCEFSDYFNWEDWAWLLALYLFLNVARMVTFLVLYPVLQRTGYGISVSDVLVMIWGGLRGAVSLSLALVVSLEKSFDEKDRALVLFHVGGIVVLTLCINGSTTGLLLGALGLNEGSVTKEKMLSTVRQELKDMTMTAYLETYYDDMLGGASYDTVRQYVGACKDWDPAVQLKHQPSIHHKSASFWTRLKLLFGWKDVAESAFPGKVKCAISRKATVRQSDYTDVIKDVRNRFLQTVKHEYSSLLESGHIEKEIMLQLKDSVNVALDHTNEPLSDWKELQETFKEPKLWVGLKLMPLPKPIRSVINQITTMRLQEANLQAAVALVTAHRMADKHLSETVASEASREVRAESVAQCEDATNYIQEIRLCFPEIASNIKTREMVRHLLAKQREFLFEASHTGLLEDAEVGQLVAEVESDLKYFLNNPPKPKSFDDSSGLKTIPLLTSLQGSDGALYKEVLAAAEPVTFLPGNVIFTKGADSSDTGAVLLARGVVTVMVPISTNGADTGRTMHLRIGSRSHPAGWILGLSEILIGGQEDGGMFEYTVKADTKVHAYVLPASLVRKVVSDQPKEAELLWRACAGMLLETSLRQDVEMPITHSLQRNVAAGEVVSLPLNVHLDPGFLYILLEGSVHSDTWGEIHAPAILSNQLPNVETDRFQKALSSIRFKEAGQMVVVHESAAPSAFETNGASMGTTFQLGDQSSTSAGNQSSGADTAIAFKRKIQGRYLKVELFTADVLGPTMLGNPLYQSQPSSVIDPTTAHMNLWSTPAVQEEIYDSDGKVLETVADPQDMGPRPLGSSLRSSLPAVRGSVLGSHSETVKARASTYTPQELRAALHSSSKRTPGSPI